LFITFEGIEGSGKSTQATLLYEWMIDKGHEVILTREPGGTKSAEEIRNFILTPKEEKFPPPAELLLYMAARSFHVENLIEPSIKKGIIVISDRFSDATVAYQGYGRGIDIKLIKTINEFATKGIKPDITILIDVPSAVGLSRLKGEKDRIEQESLEFHEKVRKGYIEIAKSEPDRVKVVDGTKSIEDIFKEVQSLIKEKMEI
jgi:dTMP kinase